MFRILRRGAVEPAGWRVVLTARLLLCLALLMTLCNFGCRCGAEDPIATLERHHGLVQRDYAAHVEEWGQASDGAEMQMGDGVRTADGATAGLRLTGGAELDMTPQTLIRFLSKMSEGEVAIDVEVGEATISAGAKRLRVSSHFGAIVIDPRSRVAVFRGARQMRFNVLVGRVSLEPKDAQTVALAAGESLTVSIGGASLNALDAGVVDSGSTGKEASQRKVARDTRIFVLSEGKGVERQGPGEQWQPMGAEKTEVGNSTALKVPKGASATVSRGVESVTLGHGKFVLGVADGALVQVSEGPVRLNTQGSTVRVPGGTIVVKEPGSSADITVGKERTRVEVHLGSVEVRGKELLDLRGGERARVQKDGSVALEGRGPSQAHLLISPGASFTVHDPAPPTVIGFETPKACMHGFVAKVGSERWAWNGQRVHVPLKPGRHKYELHCLTADGLDSKAAASGAVVILQDGGVAPIPEKAPRTGIATDGRSYTVLYQNRLPAISVRWPSAPAEAGAFTLHVSGVGGTKTISTAGPQHVFNPGVLREGRHQLYFDAATVPPRRSRTTSVNIVFDSATPTASISTPPSSVPGPGSAMTLSGTAVPGWSVSIDGKAVPVDGQSRFTVQAVVPADGRALAIAFQHPQRGIHYYLRRAGGGR